MWTLSPFFPPAVSGVRRTWGRVLPRSACRSGLMDVARLLSVALAPFVCCVVRPSPPFKGCVCVCVCVWDCRGVPPSYWSVVEGWRFPPSHSFGIGSVDASPASPCGDRGTPNLRGRVLSRSACRSGLMDVARLSSVALGTFRLLRCSSFPPTRRGEWG